VFVCRTWAGEPRPSDELDPEWFPVDAVPLDEMWDDAKRWLPAVLAGDSVSRTFVFGADLATVVDEPTSVA
jgi:8-oxo-dGTP diphosphatase